MALMATCCCSWPNTTAPSMTSSERLSASDSTISTPCAVPATTRSSSEPSASAGGIQQVLAVLVAHARTGNGAGKWHRKLPAPPRSDQRTNVGEQIGIFQKLRFEDASRSRRPRWRRSSRESRPRGASSNEFRSVMRSASSSISRRRSRGTTSGDGRRRAPPMPAAATRARADRLSVRSRRRRRSSTSCCRATSRPRCTARCSSRTRRSTPRR